VISDVVSSPDQRESGVFSTVITRRKMFPYDAGDFVFISMLHVVNDLIDTRTWDLIPRLKLFRHTSSPF
jgi:hypothetical protein